MNELSSINQFFTEIGCHFQCYDMGRLIHPIEHQTFIDFEQTNIACNSPFMQHAWLGILFWTPKSQQTAETGNAQNHTVWFLKFPLDEQAKLNLAARDDFLHRLIEALTDHLGNKQRNSQEQFLSLENVLKDNPYGFQPKQEQMANFHALVHKHLALPASQYYQNAQQYFSGVKGFEQWGQLGFQGIADIAARLDEKYHGKTNQALVTEAITYLPPSPFQALGNCLENHIISRQLVQAIVNRVILEQKQESLQSSNTSSSITIYIASIRATAQASDSELQTQLLKQILQSSANTNIEVLAAISGRCWQQLFQAELLTLFLEALAKTEQGQGAFNVIMSDLLFIPGMRNSILQAFRSPERSEQLAQAIGTFLNQIGQ